ncbi:hypothetical protein HW115_10020 [Verrucomicrobiaceae bacterium N1E253]|uniref:Uncharacterized protein n=1 Tax=Oceaniferula marina TaxID=2748318 RepID=A0A851GFG8_9BACT|nr:hypothetical protein [Oceaniferula marina]NWK55949.1 hypothetical protein [Oceaniferula marina]
MEHHKNRVGRTYQIACKKNLLLVLKEVVVLPERVGDLPEGVSSQPYVFVFHGDFRPEVDGGVVAWRCVESEECGVFNLQAEKMLEDGGEAKCQYVAIVG